MNNIDATGHSPMRRLIAELPEAALLVMNQCVTYSHDDLNHPDLKVCGLLLLLFVCFVFVLFCFVCFLFLFCFVFVLVLLLVFFF